MSIFYFVAQWSFIKVEFNALLPTGKTIGEDLIKGDKFFMVCTLATSSPDLAFARDQIFASPNIPTLDEVFCCVLHVTSIPPSSSFSLGLDQFFHMSLMGNKVVTIKEIIGHPVLNAFIVIGWGTRKIA
ncbi:hypothetical protein CR513_62586, partial [Mucuna pruriens]